MQQRHSKPVAKAREALGTSRFSNLLRRVENLDKQMKLDYIERADGEVQIVSTIGKTTKRAMPFYMNGEKLSDLIEIVNESTQREITLRWLTNFVMGIGLNNSGRPARYPIPITGYLDCSSVVGIRETSVHLSRMNVTLMYMDRVQPHPNVSGGHGGLCIGNINDTVINMERKIVDLRKILEAINTPNHSSAHNGAEGTRWSASATTRAGATDMRVNAAIVYDLATKFDDAFDSIVSEGYDIT